MPLVRNRSYYISKTDVVLREEASNGSKAVNHLLFGDWLKYLGEERNGWGKVRCRGNEGWLNTSDFSPERALEINFVDIGQGDGCHIVTPDDTVILIDAGEGDNMFRFLNWRYNLRNRKVAGVDGVVSGTPGVAPPFPIDHVVISHPDKDHYYGFRDLFASKRVLIQNVYHNGAVERPIAAGDKDSELKYFSNDDLGGYWKDESGDYHLWHVVETNSELRALIKKHKDTKKLYLSTLREAVKNNPGVKFKRLNTDDGYFPGFESGSQLEMKILGPVPKILKRGSKSRSCLARLGNEGVTKNGHSVILQARIGNLKVMLGGDLNTESEDYLLSHYTEMKEHASQLEERIYELERKGTSISPAEKEELRKSSAILEAMILKARPHFQADITKACHHGSHHFSETFLKILNSVATVVSSGDSESYAHPRPDALGAFGKYGRGVRPLVFSTELARSTKEFTHIFQYFEELKSYQARIASVVSDAEKKKIETEYQKKRDRNVAVYGMITVRTDGETAIIAQKLEVPRSAGEKWDIHVLTYNQNLGHFEYRHRGKGH